MIRRPPTDAPLFEPHALARNTDPGTSKEAAEITRAELGELQRFTLESVRSHPGLTASELARRVGASDIRTINRRLNEVEKAGLIRRSSPRPCAVTGRRALTWEPLERSAQ